MSNLVVGAPGRQLVRHAGAPGRIYLMVVIIAGAFWAGSEYRLGVSPLLAYLGSLAYVALFLVPLALVAFGGSFAKLRQYADEAKGWPVFDLRWLGQAGLVGVVSLIALAPPLVLVWSQLTSLLGFVRFPLPQVLRLESLTWQQLVLGYVLLGAIELVAAHALFLKGSTVLARHASRLARRVDLSDDLLRDLLETVEGMASNKRDKVWLLVKAVFVDIEVVIVKALRWIGGFLMRRLQHAAQHRATTIVPQDAVPNPLPRQRPTTPVTVAVVTDMPDMPRPSPMPSAMSPRPSPMPASSWQRSVTDTPAEPGNGHADAPAPLAHRPGGSVLDMSREELVFAMGPGPSSNGADSVS